ncbi:MAG: TIM barrel protein [Candidatus Aenigmatarchaeota archaeon]
MEIFLGPGGNCITAKELGTEGSFKRLVELGLNAQEIEFVRNIYLKEKSAKEIGKLAKNYGIKLSVHAPYFINLLSEDSKKVEASIRRIMNTLYLAEAMEAEFVVVHAAYYGKYTKEQAIKRIEEVTRRIFNEMERLDIRKTKLAYETMAKESQFGGLEELLELKKKLKSKQFSICIDFAHLFVRGNGIIEYSKIFNLIKDFDYIHSHFSNVKYNIKEKKFVDIHVPMNSHPSFEDLAKEILRRKINITIISESPKLELDSLKMKEIFEKFGYKF